MRSRGINEFEVKNFTRNGREKEELLKYASNNPIQIQKYRAFVCSNRYEKCA